MRIDAAFQPLLSGFNLQTLDADAATILGVWPDLRLGFTNRAWQRFAEENGAPDLMDRWPLGASIADAIPESLADWFRNLATGALSIHPEGVVYSCPSPRMSRTFRLNAYLLSGRGLLLVHSLIQEGPVLASPRGDLADAYRTGEGFIIQCSHCRCFRANAAPERWDWVPAWLDRPPARTSHSLCRVCKALYYP